MKNIELCASSFIIDEKYIWFVPMELPYLICANTSTGEIIDKVEIRATFGMFVGLYEKLFKIDNKIIGIPYWGEQYFEYDIKTRDIKLIDTPEYLRDDMGIGYYSSGVYEGVIHSFVRFYQKSKELTSIVLKLELDEYRVSVGNIDSISNGDRFDVAFRRSTVQVGQYLYLLSGISNNVIKYDLKNGTTDSVSILDTETRLTCIEIIDESARLFLMTDTEGRIILWNENTEDIKVFVIDIPGFETAIAENTRSKTEQFTFAKKQGDYVYIFPSLSNMILRYSIPDGKIEKIFDEALCEYSADSYLELNGKYSFGQFSESWIENNTIFIWNIWKKDLMTIDLSTGEINTVKITLDTEIIDGTGYFERILHKTGIIYEDMSLFTGIEDLINYLSI